MHNSAQNSGLTSTPADSFYQYHGIDDFNSPGIISPYPSEASSILSRIEDFVKELLLDHATPFEITQRSTAHQTYSMTLWARDLPDFIVAIKRLSPDYEYSERINVFISVCKDMGLMGAPLVPAGFRLYPHTRLGNFTAAECFNTLVNNIRYQWWLNNLQAKVNERTQQAQERFLDYSKYVDALFNVYARLVVLRIDLFYEKHLAPGLTLVDLQADLDHLLANTRNNSLFSAMTGYIFKLEHGIDKGVHAHALFFFDGSIRHNAGHCYLAQQIGAYWVNIITQGRGAYWNVNHNIAQYEQLGRKGIGTINWLDTQLRQNLLEYVVKYLCKTSQFIKPKTGPNVRLFRRGNFPKSRTTPLGRPRKVNLNK